MVSKKVSSNDTNVVLKKRGRKSKKELELAQQQQQEQISKSIMLNNINVIIEDSEKEDEVDKDTQLVDILNNEDSTNNEIITTNTNTTFLLDSSKNVNDNDNDNDNENDNDNDNDNDDTNNNNVNETNEKPLPKKRGRKPKGGKIIQQITPIDNNKEIKSNVILHLKCSLKDLQLSSLENDIQSYNFSNISQLSYDVLGDKKKEQLSIRKEKMVEEDNDYDCDDDEDDYKKNNDNDIRNIWKKLKVLEHNLHTNNICDKKSACFWCTCDFDNPPVYIPKHYIKHAYDVYGCFCSPECASAHLMEENIDSSSKFERYHLLNNIYAKIYDYKKNIKPAPNPYYMLDKYYGNLSIQEYRSLLRNERLFLVVDKPLTRVLPELHEDNDDFIINNKIIPSNTYQIKKKLQKKQTKNTILSERFGLNQ
jgi:hypothetical protein